MNHPLQGVRRQVQFLTLEWRQICKLLLNLFASGLSGGEKREQIKRGSKEKTVGRSTQSLGTGSKMQVQVNINSLELYIPQRGERMFFTFQVSAQETGSF